MHICIYTYIYIYMYMSICYVISYIFGILIYVVYICIFIYLIYIYIYIYMRFLFLYFVYFVQMFIFIHTYPKFQIRHLIQYSKGYGWIVYDPTVTKESEERVESVFLNFSAPASAETTPIEYAEVVRNERCS